MSVVVNDANVHFFSLSFFAGLGADRQRIMQLGWEFPESGDALGARWVADVFELAASRRGGTVERVAVFAHCGVLSVGIRKKLGLPSNFDIRFGNPLDLHGLAMKHPAVPIIIPHFGAGMLREALILADCCPNVHLDTSSSNAWIKYTPGLTLEQVFRAALDVVGPDRLLFGTDSSFFPRGWQRGIYDQQRAAFGAIGVGPDAQAKIFGGNFARLFA